MVAFLETSVLLIYFLTFLQETTYYLCNDDKVEIFYITILTSIRKEINGKSRRGFNINLTFKWHMLTMTVLVSERRQTKTRKRKTRFLLHQKEHDRLENDSWLSHKGKWGMNANNLWQTNRSANKRKKKLKPGGKLEPSASSGAGKENAVNWVFNAASLSI